jgi:phosphate-selective porin
VRFDSFDADTLNDAATRASSVGDKTFISTFGLNAFFAETTKFQVNYLLARNDAPSTGLYTADRPRKQQGLQVQFQYGF